jgi:glycosyltransferase involved in cell wall biosynthesis
VNGAPILVSVIIPVLNGASVIENQLEALRRQTYSGEWEVVVADNGSTDRTREVVEGWADRVPVRLVDATGQKGVSHARNAGAAAARGEFLTFCDADDVVCDQWLEALVEVGKDADIVAGRLDDSRNDPVVRAWRGPIPFPFVPFQHRVMAPGGNCGIWRHVYEALGGWDESFVAGSDDVAFSWQALTRGYRIGIAPDAALFYTYRPGIRPLMRQFFAYGKSEALLYKRFRGEGLNHHSARGAAELWIGLLRRAPKALRSEVDRGIWARELTLHAGRVWGSLTYRVFFL